MSAKQPQRWAALLAPGIDCAHTLQQLASDERPAVRLRVLALLDAIFDIGGDFSGLPIFGIVKPLLGELGASLRRCGQRLTCVFVNLLMGCNDHQLRMTCQRDLNDAESIQF